MVLTRSESPVLLTIARNQEWVKKNLIAIVFVVHLSDIRVYEYDELKSAQCLYYTSIIFSSIDSLGLCECTLARASISCD